MDPDEASGQAMSSACPPLDVLMADVLLSMSHLPMGGEPYLGRGIRFGDGTPVYQALMLARAVMDLTTEVRRLREAMER